MEYRRRRKILTIQTVQSEDEWGRRNFWTRSQVREILGISEPTLKRRLALLEEECPECDRVLHSRKISDFQKWCLVRLERIFVQSDRNLEKTRQHLQNIGLETDEYFKN